MIPLLRNHYYRLLENKSKFVLNIVLIIVAILGGRYINQKTSVEFHIGVIGNPSEIVEMDNVIVEELQELPPTSQLVLGDFDAVIDTRQDQLEIVSVKNEEFKSTMKSMIEGSSALQSEALSKKNAATSIMGYVMVIVFMCGITGAFLFLEDKEKHVMQRIFYSDSSQLKLIASYFIFILLEIFFITMVIITVLMKLFQLDLGMSLFNYAICIAVLSLLATSFALFNASLFQSEDEANMLGNMILLITSMMAGSFFQAPSNVGWFSTLTNILPQKHYLHLITSMSEQGYRGLLSGGFLYLVVFSVICLLLAVRNNKKRYSS